MTVDFSTETKGTGGRGKELTENVEGDICQARIPYQQK